MRTNPTPSPPSAEGILPPCRHQLVHALGSLRNLRLSLFFSCRPSPRLQPAIAVPKRWSDRRGPFALALTLALLLPAAVLAAIDASESFLQANRLYEQGHYAEAAEAYQALRAHGINSAALHFNLANAFFRSGELGSAIAHYRQAQSLAPRDPDIRANLGFARQQVAGSSSVSQPRWVRLLSELRLQEWMGLTLTGCWVTFGLLILGHWRPSLRRRLRFGVFAAALFTLGHLGAATALGHHLRQAPLAVVLTHDSPVRYGPLDESQVFFTPYEGTELTVTDRQGDWIQVTDAGQRTGWLRLDSLWIPQ